MEYSANDFMIISHEQARDEIHRRWQDEKLKQRVKEYLNDDLPDVFLHRPHGVLFRQLAVPDSETRAFMSVCAQLKIDPLITEYLSDKFTTRNQDKVRWGRIDVCEKMNKNNEPIIRSTRIIDFPSNDNRPINEVTSFWNEKIVDFFHSAFSEIGMQMPELCDMSTWFARNGGNASMYYKKYYALFIAHGVLIDYYDDIEELLKNPFFRDNEFANYCAVADHFGVKPMIVQLFSREEVERCDQWYFDAKMQGILDQRMKNVENR